MPYKIVRVTQYVGLVSCHALGSKAAGYKVGETTYSHIPGTYLFTFDTLENAKKHFKYVGFDKMYSIYECEVEGVSDNKSFLDSAIVIPEGTILSYGVKLTKLVVQSRLYKHGTKMKYRGNNLMLCNIKIDKSYYQIIDLGDGNRWSNRYLSHEDFDGGINQSQLHQLLEYESKYPLIFENDPNPS